MSISGWRRVPLLVIGAALMGAANVFLDETPAGWAIGVLGVAVFVSGTIGLCPACALEGCAIRKSS